MPYLRGVRNNCRSHVKSKSKARSKEHDLTYGYNEIFSLKRNAPHLITNTFPPSKIIILFFICIDSYNSGLFSAKISLHQR